MATCPYLVSSIANSAIYGEPAVSQDAVGDQFTLTVSSSVGWYGTQFPCRVVFPQVELAPEIAKSIYNNNLKRVLFDDYLIDDTFVRQKADGMLSKQLLNSAPKMKRLYIIPFLSDANKCYTAGAPTLDLADNMLPPMRSCVSSAPVTCSHLKLENVQLQVGTQNIFLQDLASLSLQHYELNAYSLQNKVSGNAVNSLYRAGLITRRMFLNCYNVYCYDVCMVDNEEDFDRQALCKLRFTALGNPLLLYDFLIIIEYQKSVTVNVVTSEVDRS